ncbi:MAG: pyridoxal phosphate-dependent decarboxylase family protein [Gemmatimonadaceae bacterium]
MTAPLERSLDPGDDAEWAEMSALGHRMMDDMLAFLRGIRDEPAWRPMPAEIRNRLHVPPPMTGEGAERAYADFRELVLPYRVGNIHPRFWGRVQGTGSVVGMLAELLAGGINENGSGLASAASQLEAQVLEWCCTLLGYPSGSSGVLVSGGSVANLVGLTVARHAIARRCGADVGRDGIAALATSLVVYSSTESHNSIDRALALLGLGTASLRRLPTDDGYRIQVEALERAIRNDRADGRVPMAIVGNAGTVNSGATDDLQALADIAARHRLWLHVDSAFGAWAALSPTLRTRLSGLERADSVAFDLHKWMYMPYDVGAVLVRDPALHRAAFTTGATGYIGRATRGAEADEYRFNELGPQLSRACRALKVWLSIKAYGVDAYRRQIEQNVAQAAYLAGLIAADPELELLAPAPLNIVCFRYRPAAAASDTIDLDALNREILVELHEQGIAVPTSGRIRGVFAIRCAITNHRSRREDFDRLVQGVLAIGRANARRRMPHVAR